jgi:hypothetical protein
MSDSTDETKSKLVIKEGIQYIEKEDAQGNKILFELEKVDGFLLRKDRQDMK